MTAQKLSNNLIQLLKGGKLKTKIMARDTDGLDYKILDIHLSSHYGLVLVIEREVPVELPRDKMGKGG